MKTLNYGQRLFVRLARSTGATIAIVGKQHRKVTQMDELCRFTSAWTTSDIEFLGLPERSTVNEFPVEECAKWIARTEDLPAGIMKHLGKIDISAKSRMISNMEYQIKQYSFSRLTGPLITTVKAPTSERMLYPLVYAFLNICGMEPVNNFQVTDDSDPRNCVEFQIEGIKLKTIFDIVAWYDTELALSLKIEVKRKKSQYKYNQWVGQLLMQALRELHLNNATEGIIESCGVSICGSTFRFATLHCEDKYLRSIMSGKPNLKLRPELKLSEPHDLLELNSRILAAQVFYGRVKFFNANPIIEE